MWFWIVDCIPPSGVRLVVIMVPPGRSQFTVADQVPTSACACAVTAADLTAGAR